MIYKKWHFQLFGILSDGVSETLLFSSQDCPNPKIKMGFSNQLYAMREATEYIRVIRQNPLESKISAIRIFCFECHWSDLFSGHELNKTIEIINALSVGKPKITYPKP